MHTLRYPCGIPASMEVDGVVSDVQGRTITVVMCNVLNCQGPVRLKFEVAESAVLPKKGMKIRFVAQIAAMEVRR